MASNEMVSIARLALAGKEADLRLYLAKQVRKLKKDDPATAGKLEELLKSQPARSSGVMRRGGASLEQASGGLINSDSELSLLKVYESLDPVDEPLLQSQIHQSLHQVLKEHESLDALKVGGLKPTSSLIFQGAPGVGKTMTARWLAAQLELPFYILDLTAVMSSYLGKTGSNLRSAIEFAKTHPCVLLLDEIDAIAKKRSDEADVGELKRLVTVMLQELEDWPAGGLLIAATNHPELVDPALWRRFDLELSFPIPSITHTRKAVERFLGHDAEALSKWVDLYVEGLKGRSYSHIRRVIYQLRRLKIVAPEAFEDSMLSYLIPDISELTRADRIGFAVKLVEEFSYPIMRAAKVAGVSRDTIRKRIAA